MSATRSSHPVSGFETVVSSPTMVTSTDAGPSPGQPWIIKEKSPFSSTSTASVSLAMPG